jgi:hypothetical protein
LTVLRIYIQPHLTADVRQITFDCDFPSIKESTSIRLFVAGIAQRGIGDNWPYEKLVCSGIGTFSMPVASRNQIWRFEYTSVAKTWQTLLTGKPCSNERNKELYKAAMAAELSSKESLRICQSLVGNHDAKQLQLLINQHDRIAPLAKTPGSSAENGRDELSIADQGEASNEAQPWLVRDNEGKAISFIRSKLIKIGAMAAMEKRPSDELEQITEFLALNLRLPTTLPAVIEGIERSKLRTLGYAIPDRSS